MSTGGSGGGAGGGARPPPRIDGMVSLKVDNLTYRTTPEDLRRVFERCGEVGDIYIPRDRYTRESRGFAFVRFYDKRDAEDALEAMDGRMLDGRELRVQMARYGRPSSPTRRNSSSSRRGAGLGAGAGGGAGGRRRSRSRSPMRRRSRSPRRRSSYSPRSRSRSAGSRSPGRRSKFSRSPVRGDSRNGIGGGGGLGAGGSRSRSRS
ncbi:serine/arginine-rich splicing factor 2 [Drosophila sulfurigaster albostrigata]|uniref:Serine/arginine-rich splicing factor 2 n=1 Tax=Drosophila albomicans TaxID=7291 RepID=A0A6P8W2L9_DROAB|nr:serine/arginine-rich splicing factor 2 [Drosophila albomicans]XP_060666855.1 serine/arginine-rich splicing factor 2 [Drosophila nasuta]XP_062142042.1 serine/arginine-rich splicing factor 2 [Drosophila sulfurigaster albostrigata]